MNIIRANTSNPNDRLLIGMVGEERATVTPEMTVAYFVRGMPAVYATPIMILHMEMASGSAIEALLPSGFVSVGMDVNVRTSRLRRSGAWFAQLPGQSRSPQKRYCSKSRPGTATVKSATAPIDGASSMSSTSKDALALLHPNSVPDLIIPIEQGAHVSAFVKRLRGIEKLDRDVRSRFWVGHRRLPHRSFGHHLRSKECSPGEIY